LPFVVSCTTLSEDAGATCGRRSTSVIRHRQETPMRRRLPLMLLLLAVAHPAVAAAGEPNDAFDGGTPAEQATGARRSPRAPSRGSSCRPG